MVLIKNGANGADFKDIADQHWNIINPYIHASQRYYKGQALIDRVQQKMLHHQNAGNVPQYNFYHALLSRNLLQRLVVSPANLLPALITEVQAILTSEGLTDLKDPATKFGAELLDEVFQYENWRSNGKGGKLYQLLNYKVCPYCNLAQIFNDPVRDFLVLAYDHYYDKGKYPYLSLSFANLIPVCQPCNHPYKGSKSFSLATHLHPYIDDFNTNAVFTSNYAPGVANYKVNINALNLPNPKTDLFVKDLGFEVRYDDDNIKKTAKRIFNLSQEYPTVRKQALAHLLRSNVAHVEEKICKEHDICFAPSGILFDMKGKLKRDLSKQYGIITTIP